MRDWFGVPDLWCTIDNIYTKSTGIGHGSGYADDVNTITMRRWFSNSLVLGHLYIFKDRGPPKFWLSSLLTLLEIKMDNFLKYLLTHPI